MATTLDASRSARRARALESLEGLSVGDGTIRDRHVPVAAHEPLPAEEGAAWVA